MSTPEGIADAMRIRAEATERKAADKAEAQRRLRITLAAGFLREVAGTPGDDHFREECQRALRWADILLEEAKR